MGRVRSGIRLLLSRLPLWALLPLVLAGVGTGYLVVRWLQFEYHFRAACGIPGLLTRMPRSKFWSCTIGCEV